MTTKICTSCRLNLPIDNYGKDIRTKSGIRNKCKKCVNQHVSAYQKANRQKFNELDRNKKAKNRELYRCISKKSAKKRRGENISLRNKEIIRCREYQKTVPYKKALERHKNSDAYKKNCVIGNLSRDTGIRRETIREKLSPLVQLKLKHNELIKTLKQKKNGNKQEAN